MILLLDDAAVRAGFDWNQAVSALRDAYAGAVDTARYPARGMARGDHGWLRTLSGAPADDGLMGAKQIAVNFHDAKGAFLISLFDQRTSRLVALLDGHAVTGYRTAASSALAADLLSLPGPLNVAVIGSGFEARNHVRAVAAVRELKSVRVYSPRQESRTSFAADLADLPAAVSAVDSAESAVAEATLVICAARSRDESPTLLGEWLRPGMTVVSIGSTLPEQREVDTTVIARSDVIIGDVVDEVRDDTGDLIAARAAGVDVVGIGSLADLVAGRHSGRTAPEQIALYKSVGSAVQDLAVAAMCVRNAERLGLGTQVADFVVPMGK
ncbi:ornithine cyclodeaminase family protein [Streptomyces sp. NBC_01352]|uniref:ornithine cyclodeaminase family protein n=1 Tax=Streptomyces sp. NBC_01352 TaxID=2903834 RepID=UPI002E32F60C|nr:ornithine cyclodeaminase family protein [Streptomyces sp. NBC_01352]